METTLNQTNTPVSSAFLETYFSTLAENCPLAIAQLDKTGQIIKANSGFVALLGKEQFSAIADHAFADYLRDDSKPILARLLEEGLRGERADKPHSIELKNSRDETSDHPVTVTVYVTCYDNTENAESVIVHLVDTTEQKKLEVRFAHSQKMQAVGQLAGGVAHDFNNLLTAMIGFCDLLLMRHPAGDPSFADIMQIKQNANRAANLVRQLLAFSRRQTLQPKVLEMTDVLAELSHLLRRLIGDNIELNVVHGRDCGSIKVDQGQLEQVIINLAVNARDAMNSKGGMLTIRTSDARVSPSDRLGKHMISPAEEDSIADGDYVLVEVQDTGCGIAPELIQQIFEPFFSTKAVGSGTGLGLSTVYGIVKQTGGYIYVSSAPDEGTTFSIFFPRYQENGSDKGEGKEKQAAADLTGTGTILLVEDETPVRTFASRALTNKGYKVLEADSAETALDIIDESGTEVDVIITDVMMPGMTGPDMVQQVMKKYPDIEVIFISGYAEDAFVDSYGNEREFHFLPKPFTLKQLASKVKEVLTANVAAEA